MLAVEGVGKVFGGLRALADVSFSVRRGTITALIGPNGAGKTTLFNIVSGVLRPTTGSVRFKDRDVSGWPPHRICALGLSRTFQNIQLFASLNSLENVMAARYCRTRAGFLDTCFMTSRSRREQAASRARAHELLGWVGIAHRRLAMPGALPYGDQRRLEIARALATDPELLMLDEPSAGMISSEVEDLTSLLVRLRDAGTTIVLIEHNMGFVMSVSDHVIVLNFGEKIAEGPPDHIQRDARVIEAYLGTQG